MAVQSRARQLGIIVAGLDYLRIGDVTGPDKDWSQTFTATEAACRYGWRYTRDPIFAWPIVNIYGRKGAGDVAWSELTKVATQIPRASWQDNRSRYLANWAGILETGLEHDDHRFCRAAYVRIGRGIGHEHADSLDLQIVAHGMPMTMDDGQRSGYSEPS